MGRRVSVGIAPAGFGGLSVDNNIIETAQTNQNLILSPNGSGDVQSTANFQLNAQADLRFADSDSSNWVAFQAPSTISSNVTWTLPSADGASNAVLSTNASGTLSWQAPSVTLSDQTSSTNTFYPLFSGSTSGQASTVNVASTRMTFQPSSGTLIATIGQYGIVQGGTGASGNLVLRSTTSGTKGQVYIDETTPASSTTSGALRVGGGIGVAGTGYFAGVNTTDLTASGTITFTGPVRVQELVEDMVDVAHASNVVALDYSAGNIFFLTNTPGASMTVNISNVPTTDGRIFSINLIVTQGGTGFNPTTVNINGSGVTLKWTTGTVPTPTSSAGKIDVYTFTILRRSSAYTLLGAQAPNF